MRSRFRLQRGGAGMNASRTTVMTDALADVVVILAILAMPAALAQSGVPDPARTPGALNSMNTQKTMRHPLASAPPSHGSRR